MNLYEVFERFPTQQACIDHLEGIRFAKGAYCPLCGSVENVKRKRDGNRVGRWNCHDCHRSFNVLSGTFMQGTQIALPKWFAAIAIMINAKKSVSSPQLARDLNLTQPTALFMQKRIRNAMASDHAPLLAGIVEADETYVGGKPRKSNKKDDNDTPNKRGRGTKKTAVIGAVERDGKVIAKVAEDLTGKGIVNFLKNVLNMDESVLYTDEYPAYNIIQNYMPHEVINHSIAYSDDGVNTNTIEGFWSLLKRAWYGTHHHYTPRFMNQYIAEASWKFNHRQDAAPWNSFMYGVFA